MYRAIDNDTINKIFVRIYFKIKITTCSFGIIQKVDFALSLIIRKQLIFCFPKMCAFSLYSTNNKPVKLFIDGISFFIKHFN